MSVLPSVRLLPLLALILLLPSSPLAAEPQCTCLDGNACYHTLKAPVSPPNDPCSCPGCRSARGSCPDRLPEGWNRDCATDKSMKCFLRRHAASWQIACSEMLEGTCGCKREHPEFCPRCGKDGRAWASEGLEIIKRQIQVERQIIGFRKKFVLLTSPRFYVLTDIPTLRIEVQGGGVRQIGMHEIAHVYLQRAELAYQDFIAAFGDRMTYERPCAIFLLEDEKMKQKFSQRYFGNWEPELLYGADAKTISGGFGYNGLALSNDKWRDDFDMHFQMRHLLGHLFISTWVTGGGATDILPKWMYIGAGHWLARLPKKFHTEAEFCAGEGFTVSDSGDRWHLKCRKYARDRKAVPIQRILDTNAIEELDLECHIRAWSWFDVFLREDRDRFRAYLSGIRQGKKAPESMKEAFGCNPTEFDRRWRERIMGTRPSVAATPAELDAQDPTRPGAQERGEIRTEKDLDVLASRIRALHTVNDRLTTATLVPLLASKSEGVREAIVLVLSRSTSEEVRAYLRTRGLEETGGITRAFVIRIIGNLGDAEAADALTAHAGDPEWLTRANVARALSILRHEPAIPLLVKMVKDPAAKVRISAMDALARFGKKGAVGTSVVAAVLSARAWQLRSAAADCLLALDDEAAIDPLIDRMLAEGGRVHRDVHNALKKITGDDLGGDARYWREWWDKEQARRDAGAPRTRPKIPANDGYAEPPTTYGIRIFSARVGYVLDCSSSMIFEVSLDPEWLKRHRRTYRSRDRKFTLARHEIAETMKLLDPRSLVNLYFFKSTASAWKTKLVPASPRNLGQARAHMEAKQPPIAYTPRGSGGRQTNYIDVFRLVLDVKKDAIPPGFADTPDTIFFLTDGKPTVGDITDPDTLLGWFREYNRFARLKVNVITMGKLEMNPRFLRALAEENGGTFVQIPSVD